MKPAVRTLLALLPMATLLAAAPARHAGFVSFVACPVARDTGPDTDMCFFAEHDGVRYGLSGPPDWGAPQLKHRVLVEGRVLPDAPPVCGGIALDARVSVLPEIDTACDLVVPASAEAPPPAPNPQTQRRIEERLRAVEADPAQSLKPLRGGYPPYPVLEGESGTETYYLPFDSERLSGFDAMRLVSLAKMPGVRIHISATRGATRLDEGGVLVEPEGVAARRARRMEETLIGLGVPAEAIRTSFSEKPPRPSGREDWRSRRVDFAWTRG